MTTNHRNIVLISPFEKTGRLFLDIIQTHIDGGHLSVFRSLEQAISEMAAVPVDSVVLEGHHFDIIEMCRNLRQPGPFSDTPVLAVTVGSDGSPDAFSSVTAAGADDVVAAPPDEIKTAHRLELFCRLKQSEDRRKRAEQNLEALTVKYREALISSERRYRRLVEISPDTIAVCTDGSITYINAAGNRLLHADHIDDLIGKAILDLVQPESREVMKRIMESSVVGDEHIPFVLVKMNTLDNAVVQAEAAAVRFDGVDQRHVLLVMRDVGDRTELSEKFRQAQRMEEA